MKRSTLNALAALVSESAFAAISTDPATAQDGRRFFVLASAQYEFHAAAAEHAPDLIEEDEPAAPPLVSTIEEATQYAADFAVPGSSYLSEVVSG